MTQRFSDRSIKVKLRIIVLVICTVVLLITSFVGLVGQRASSRAVMVENLTVLAHVVGSNSQAALMFKAFEDAAQVLSALGANPHIFQAYLYDAEGVLFSQYKRVVMPSFTIFPPVLRAGINTTEAGAQFHLSYLELSVPIILDKENIGFIHIYSDLKALYSSLFEQLLATLLTVLGALGIAYFISFKMERLIVDPVLYLAKVIKQVLKHKHYRFRIDKVNEYEMGTLVDGINGILGEIQAQNEQLEKHQTHLEQRVAERTEQLSNKNKLLTQRVPEATETQESEKKVNESHSEFMANISHELHVPMKAVLDTAGLLNETNLDKKQQCFTDTIHRSAMASLSRVNDILDCSKIISGQLALDNRAFDIRTVLEEVIKSLTEPACQKGLELMYKVQPDINTIYQGDSGRLQQILFNLTENAIEWTDSGHIQVHMKESEILDETTAVLEFEIRSTRVGMTQQYIDTRIGSTISRQLIQLMGGNFRVESEVENGSLFRFTLDLQTGYPSAGYMNQLWGMRILVVGDNEAERETILHQLTAWQATCLGIAQGIEALQLLQMATRQARPFQVVLLDLHTTDMDSMSLAQRIVENPQINNLRLIMLNASADSGTISNLKKVGIETYLTKPVNQADLYRYLSHQTEAPMETLTLLGERSRYGLRILLAESNIINQEVAVGMLEQMGCQVTAVNNTQKALDAWSKDRYDLILMGLQMSDKGGLKAVEEIRRQEQGSATHIPVIALIANLLPGDKETCLLAGMDDYLNKPFTLVQLQHILTKYAPKLRQGSATAIEVKTETKAELPVHQAVAEEIKNDEAILDTKALDNIRSLQQPGKPNVLKKVIELYLHSATELMLEMHTAIENDDIEVVQRAAHTLKSSSANLGANDLAKGCQLVEKRAREKQMSDIGPFVNKIVNDFDEVNKELKTILKDQAA